LKGIRDKVQIATKFANYWDGPTLKVRGDPEYVRSCCEGSLKRLEVDYIDLYYQHRVDDKVPIEITVRYCMHALKFLNPYWENSFECIDVRYFQYIALQSVRD